MAGDTSALSECSSKMTKSISFRNQPVQKIQNASKRIRTGVAPSLFAQGQFDSNKSKQQTMLQKQSSNEKGK